MKIYLPLEYCITVRRDYVTDWIPWNVKLTEDAAEIYQEAISNHKNLYDIPELTAIMEQAKEAIRAEEIDNMLVEGDPYTLECYGRIPADAEQINILIKAHDEKILAALDLEDFDEEALKEFDAATDIDEDQLPLVCDIDPDFIPEDPFNGMYELDIRFAKPKASKQWKAEITLTCAGQNSVSTVAFDVPEEYYGQLQQSVDNHKSIRICPCYNDLGRFAVLSHDLDSYNIAEEIPAPKRTDYPCYEAYDEAYLKWIDFMSDTYFILDVEINDPYKDTVLGDYLVGRNYPGLSYDPADGDPVIEEFELNQVDNLKCAHYVVNIGYNPDGTIISAEIIISEAMDENGEYGVCGPDVEPDLDFLIDSLEDEFKSREQNAEGKYIKIEPESKEQTSLKLIAEDANEKSAVIADSRNSEENDLICKMNTAIDFENVPCVYKLLMRGVLPGKEGYGVMSPLTSLVLHWHEQSDKCDTICMMFLDHGVDPNYSLPYRSLANVIEEYGGKDLKEYYAQKRKDKSAEQVQNSAIVKEEITGWDTQIQSAIVDILGSECDANDAYNHIVQAMGKYMSHEN